MDHRTELLLKLDILQEFYTEEIETISEYFSIHKFFDLQVIMPQTGRDSSFGIILSGEVSISDDQIENSSRTKGDILGEMAFIHGLRSDFIAASDGAIAIMTFDDIEKLKLKQPYLAVKLVNFVTSNLIDQVKAIMYLRDPVKVESNPASVEALSRLCDLQQVLFATNLLTANAIFQYLE
ncbi:hypothetical protein [Planktothrix agardhii]|uniref:hypothetical protein n=1 Tax=Planktothrix agardhii TaxID=1160 RepID=UPI00042A0FE8|nr:hypothetical protein [Planktothrix agardhii]